MFSLGFYSAHNPRLEPSATGHFSGEKDTEFFREFFLRVIEIFKWAVINKVKGKWKLIVASGTHERTLKRTEKRLLER